MTTASTGITLLYTTWPDPDAPADAARRLLDERLIACANILGASFSIYRWRGKVETATETIALFKTDADTAQAAMRRLVELHPYDEPCVIALDVDTARSAPGFVDWVAAETRPG